MFLFFILNYFSRKTNYHWQSFKQDISSSNSIVIL